MRRRLPLVLAVLAVFLVWVSPLLAFPDVPGGHSYVAAIDDLSSRGIINGFPDGTFGPDRAVTRQQFAKMVVLTFAIPVTEADICPFSDVQVGGYADPFFPDNYISVCATNEITKGTSATTSSPGDPIKRAQLLTMVVRAANRLRPGMLAAPSGGYSGSLPNFTDPDHAANLRMAEYNSLLAGLQGFGASWNPWSAATRGEVAQVLHNMLLLIDSTSPATTTTLPTTTTTFPPSTTTIVTNPLPTTTTTTQGPNPHVYRYTGTGDEVLDISKDPGPALIWIKGNAAQAYFGVVSRGPGYDGPFTYYDLLANTADPYEGISLIDYEHFLSDARETKRLEIKATGTWQVEIRPIGTARTIATPGTITGGGDDVLLVHGSPSKLLITGNQGGGYFGVWAYYGQDEMYDLLVNTADPYTGRVGLSHSSAKLISVKAERPWSISAED